MNIIIFSKDRPAQLDLLLRSMKAMWPEWSYNSLSIIYKCSHSWYFKGYNGITMYFEDRPEPECFIRFIYECDFKRDVLSVFDNTNEHTMFLTDDNVFINPYTLDTTALSNPSIACISLRLHPSLKWCVPAHCESKGYVTDQLELYWPSAQGDMGYPMSLDGHIFRTDDILPMLRELDYRNPNELEARMAERGIDRNWMKIQPKSVVLNVPYNQVQTMWKLPHGKASARYMNWKYIKGYRLDLSQYIGWNNSSCHEIVPLRWIIQEQHTA